MHTLVILVLMALATHRLTRLITRDHLPLISIPREAFVRRWAIYDSAPEGVVIDPRVSVSGRPTNLTMRSLAFLLECDWCMSVWVGGILTLTTVHLISLPLPWLMWPAVSSIAALIAERESE